MLFNADNQEQLFHTIHMKYPNNHSMLDPTPKENLMSLNLRSNKKEYQYQRGEKICAITMSRPTTLLCDKSRPRPEAPLSSRNSNNKSTTRHCGLVGLTQAGVYRRAHGPLGECDGGGLRAQEAKVCGACSRCTTTRLES